jgi:PAS domain S-box-containing protein
VLEFPTWIAFAFIFSPALNGIVNRGLLGFGISLASTFLGILAGLVVHGYVYWPATSSVVTLLAFTGSLCYAAGVGYVLFRQTRHMSEARERLRTSEIRYRLIAEHAGDLVAMVDRDGRWLYASPSYARIFRKDDLAVGGDAFRNLHEEDQFRVRGAVQVVVRSGEPCRLRLRLHTMNGEVRRFDTMVHPVKSTEAEGGEKTHGAVLASRDVTELRDREEQLEVAAHAFERMAEGMMITNAPGASSARTSPSRASRLCAGGGRRQAGERVPHRHAARILLRRHLRGSAAQRPLGRHHLVPPPRRHGVPGVAQRERGARRRRAHHPLRRAVPRTGQPRRRARAAGLVREIRVKGPARKLPRIVRLNYAIRTAAFAYCFVVMGLLFWERHMSLAAWGMLALQFLAYPHLVWLRARTRAIRGAPSCRTSISIRC